MYKRRLTMLMIFQMQPFMDSTERFSDNFDCIGYMTPGILSGLMVMGLIIMGLSAAWIMILDIRSPDKFESNRSKQLTITVQD